nr:uncharacterized protein LOC109167327 [Ipomoea batatas]
MATSNSSSDSNPASPTNDLPTLQEFSKKVKNRSMLGKDGFLKHSTNPTMMERVLKCLQNVGLMKYVCHDYKLGHSMDAIDFFCQRQTEGGDRRNLFHHEWIRGGDCPSGHQGTF